VVPVGWSYDREHDCTDVGGRIHPDRVVSWGLEHEAARPEA
jgi:hypothetical protein